MTTNSIDDAVTNELSANKLYSCYTSLDQFYDLFIMTMKNYVLHINAESLHNNLSWVVYPLNSLLLQKPGHAMVIFPLFKVFLVIQLFAKGELIDGVVCHM